MGKRPIICLATFMMITTASRLFAYEVTPVMGGGQTAASMVHIAVHYDSISNTLSATLDHSAGIPELRALAPDHRFDPNSPLGQALTGKSYNAQYGWLPGGFFAVPPGGAVWVGVL